MPMLLALNPIPLYLKGKQESFGVGSSMYMRVIQIPRWNCVRNFTASHSWRRIDERGKKRKLDLPWVGIPDPALHGDGVMDKEMLSFLLAFRAWMFIDADKEMGQIVKDKLKAKMIKEFHKVYK